MPTNGIKKIPSQKKFTEFCVMEQAIRMRWATLFKLSHRIVIDHTIDTSIINTTVMLKYVPLQHGTDAACMPKSGTW